MEDVREIAIFGRGEVADTLYELCGERQLKITAFSDYQVGSKFHDLDAVAPEALADFKGEVVVGSCENLEQMVRTLKEAGVDSEKVKVVV